MNVFVKNNFDLSGMKLHLINCNLKTDNMICLTSNTNKYTFYGLSVDNIYNLTLTNKWGDLITSINLIKLNINDNNIELIATNTYSISLTLLDNYSNIVNSHAKIIWYDEYKNYLMESSIIDQLILGTKFQYEIILDNILGLEYYNIKSQLINVTSDNKITVKLLPINKINILGHIVDENGNPIDNVVILVSQILNSNYHFNKQSISTKNGYFNIIIYESSCNLTLTRNGYISKTIEIDDVYDNMDIGSILLSKIKGFMIYFDINYIQSSVKNENIINDLYYNSNDLKLRLSNSITKKEIKDFIFQNNYLILLKSMNLKDPIEVNVEINSDEFNPTTIYLNNNISNISITLVQKGYLILKYEENQNANSIAMIYNQKGILVNEIDFTINNVTSSFLTDGDYTVVAIGKNNFFKRIDNLQNLILSKLEKNKDYVSQKVHVTSSKISFVEFKKIPKFDEYKFCYIDVDKTIFIPNKASSVVGSYFSIKGHVEFKVKYKSNISNIKILIEIPENCTYYPGSFVIDKIIAPFTLDGNKMVTSINIDADIFRFCLIPTVKGFYIVNAFIEFELNNEKIFQPIQGAKFEVKEMDFFVKDKTGLKNIISFGVAPLMSKILLYCDEMLVGETKSNSDGEWQIEFELINPSTYSKHSIYVKVIPAEGIAITSKVKNLIYSRNYVDVYQITLILGRTEVVIDYLNTNQKYFYGFPAGQNRITFLINFTRNNPDVIKNVKLIILTVDDKIVSIPAFYDNDKKVWIASKIFTRNYPVGIEVKYKCEENFIIPDEYLNESSNITKEEIDIFEKSLEIIEIKLEIIENSFSFEKQRGKIIYKLHSSNMSKEGICQISILEDIDKEIEKIKQNTNYIIINSNDNDNKYLLKKPGGKQIEIVKINKKNKTIENISFPIEPIIDNDIYRYEDEIYRYGYVELKNEIQESFKGVTKLIENIDSAYNEICNFFDFLPELKKACNYYNLFDSFRAFSELKEVKQKAESYIMKLMNSEAQCIPEDIKDQLTNMVFKYYFSYIGKLGCKFSRIVILPAITEKLFDCYKDQQIELFDLLYDEYKCNPDIQQYPNGALMSVRVYALIDPSGYVYEAVESNRIKGVTTIIFEKVTKVDIYGEQYETAEIWNAQLYGQKNPLKTDDLGWYAWDVPKGLWKVKYEKLNYEILYTDWLPVPPPQLYVNVPIVSFIQPEIKRINGYENRIEIEFTKYMKREQLNSNSIVIVYNNSIVNGNICYLNEEVDPNNHELTYVSLLHFQPKKQFQIGDEVNILIKNNVSSYSGVIMNSDYNKLIDIKVEPKIMVDSEMSNIIYGEKKEFNYWVYITPKESIKGKKLILQSDSSKIIELNSDFIDINNDGNAEIPIKILLPGVAHIEMKIEGTDIKSIKTINIDLPKSKLNPVSLSINVDSCINEKTSIELISNIEDSTIFYSINPKNIDYKIDDFQIYHGSIIITKDIHLSTFAQHDNYMNSDIVTYDIKVCNDFTDIQSSLIIEEFTSIAQSNQINDVQKEHSPNNNSKTIIIGVSIGCAALIIVIVVVVAILKKKKRIRNFSENENDDNNKFTFDNNL